MFGLLVGALTEYANGVDFVDQARTFRVPVLLLNYFWRGVVAKGPGTAHD